MSHRISMCYNHSVISLIFFFSLLFLTVLLLLSWLYPLQLSRMCLDCIPYSSPDFALTGSLTVHLTLSWLCPLQLSLTLSWLSLTALTDFTLTKSLTVLLTLSWLYPLQLSLTLRWQNPLQFYWLFLYQIVIMYISPYLLLSCMCCRLLKMHSLHQVRNHQCGDIYV